MTGKATFLNEGCRSEGSTRSDLRVYRRPLIRAKFSERAHCSQTGDRDATAALPNLVAVEAVGAVRERDSTRRIGPSDLSARAAVPERRGRVGFPETTKVGHA